MTLLLWWAFAIAEGIREGAHFSHGNYKYPFNIHKFFMPVRIVVALILIIYNYTGVFQAFAMLTAFSFTFPFFHDGLYYETRSMIDYPKYNFFSRSATTTATFSFGFPARLAGLIAGMVVFYLFA